MVSVLIHPTPAARLSAAWCLRSIAVALLSQMTILIERCMSRMHHLKSSPEAISGYSFALAALLGGVRYTSLGIPHAKGKVGYFVAHIIRKLTCKNNTLDGKDWFIYITANIQHCRRLTKNSITE